MKRRIGTALLLIFGLAPLLSGCLFGPTVVTEANAGSLIQLNVGDSLLVRLAGNPSTGFSWVRTDPEFLTAEPLEAIEEGTCDLSDQCGTVGQPGTFEFRYRASKPGTMTLAYAYQRPWERDSLETFAIIVWVR